MARKEARIFTSIWSDKDFIDQMPTAQRLYFFLLSQPDLSYCGVLALRERRWSMKARGMTVEQIREDLDALSGNPSRKGSGNPSPNPSGNPSAKGSANPSEDPCQDPPANPFLVIDEDTEEVFIRSFIRYDGVWRQPNLLKAARDAAHLIESPKIRAALLAELQRLPADTLTDQGRKVLNGMIGDLAGEQDTAPDDPSANPSGKGSRNPSANPSGNPSPNPLGERGEGRGERESLSPLPNPLSPIPSPLSPLSGPARTIADATDATPDETREILELIKNDNKPRNLAAYVKTLAKNGDLPALLERIRTKETQPTGERQPFRGGSRAKLPTAEEIENGKVTL